MLRPSARVVQVTLQLQPLFKRSITNIQRDDFDLERGILLFGLEHEFADVTWYPAQRKAIYRVDDRVSVTTPGDGVNDFTGFRPILSVLLATAREAGKRIQHGYSQRLTHMSISVSPVVEIIKLTFLNFSLNVQRRSKNSLTTQRENVFYQTFRFLPFLK